MPTRKRPVWLAVLVLGILFVACNCRGVESEPELGAGFRYSSYGPPYNPGPEYWADVGQQMASRFPEATPQAIWIVGIVSGKGAFLNFPAEPTDRLIYWSQEDDNEETLALFDEEGVQVWLQVEPGNAPVEELIHIMLDQYGHHPCVVGVGVDVEWYQSYAQPEGKAVSDAEAEAWLAAARSHGDYRLFLKHWLIEKMPPTTRDGILFVDDSQGFSSMDAMVEEFTEWGEAFAPAPVAFQYGYDSDRKWWQELDDPPGEIGEQILNAVPNTEGLYWVDFTLLQVFPP